MGAINPHVDVTLEEIEQFCRKWSITRFELFGSVLRDDFDADSDVDVMVTFVNDASPDLSSYLDMVDELQVMFGRKVDVVKRHLMEKNPNWVRRRAILGSAQTVYAAA